MVFYHFKGIYINNSVSKVLSTLNFFIQNLGWLSFLLPEQITINFFGLLTEKCICRKPRLCILMYVGSVIIVAVLSAFLGNWEMASVFDAYLPSVAKVKKECSYQNDALNVSTASEVYGVVFAIRKINEIFDF